MFMPTVEIVELSRFTLICTESLTLPAESFATTCTVQLPSVVQPMAESDTSAHQTTEVELSVVESDLFILSSVVLPIDTFQLGSAMSVMFTEKFINIPELVTE